MDPNAQWPPHREPPVSSGFDFNRPTIIGLLYLLSLLVGVTALVGVILAYVWRNEAHEPWEATHYRYLINTFWLSLVGSVIGFVLMLVVIGFAILAVVGVLVIVRTVLSLVKAQRREPMPKPGTWLA